MENSGNKPELGSLGEVSATIGGHGQQQQPSLFQKPIISSIARLKNLFHINMDAIGAEMDDLIKINTDLIKDNQELLQKYSVLEQKHNKVVNDYNATLNLIETGKLDSAIPVIKPETGVLFDSAIHQHKPSRPITNVIRLEILNAYESVYKKSEDVKTLPDFFKYVNENISPTASKTEIEGVIYNRFDERLYLA